jgi:hypothetical protein
MYPRAIEVKHLGDYRLEIIFEDGVRAELDFSPMVGRGGIFASLKDLDCFRQVNIDTEAETLVWPGGIDICPDVLYHLATNAPLPGELPHRAAHLVRLDRAAVKSQ